MSRFRPLAAITEIIIHCTHTPNGRPGTALDIDRGHGRLSILRHPDAPTGGGQWVGRGLHAPQLKHIGYHFVVRVDGVVECGRRLTETGEHAKGHDLNSIGICLFGTDAFTAAQWDSLRILVKGLKRDLAHEGVRDIRVIGHRDVAAHTACPGFDVAACPGFDVAAWLDGDLTLQAQHAVEVLGD